MKGQTLVLAFESVEYYYKGKKQHKIWSKWQKTAKNFYMWKEYYKISKMTKEQQQKKVKIEKI